MNECILFAIILNEDDTLFWTAFAHFWFHSDILLLLSYRFWPSDCTRPPYKTEGRHYTVILVSKDNKSSTRCESHWWPWSFGGGKRPRRTERCIIYFLAKHIYFPDVGARWKGTFHSTWSSETWMGSDWACVALWFKRSSLFARMPITSIPGILPTRRGDDYRGRPSSVI